MIPVVMGVVLALLIALFMWRLAIHTRERIFAAPDKLAEHFDTTRGNAGSETEPRWYVSKYRNHSFAFTFVGLKDRKLTAVGRMHKRWKTALRLALEVQAPGPLGASAYRHPEDRLARAGESFSQVFGRTNEEAIPDSVVDALLSFARQNGSIRLRDRSECPPVLVHRTVLTEHPIVLVHETYGLDFDKAEVIGMLDAMLEIAALLEAS